MLHGSVPGKPGNLLEITPAKIVGKNFKYQRHLTRPVRNIKVHSLLSTDKSSCLSQLGHRATFKHFCLLHIR